jgi:cysteine desulfurase
MTPIYLDYNATTPIDPAVADAMLPFIHRHFGNPSSSHLFGVTAKKAVETARRQVAEMLGCAVDEVIFTSGGSEANNLAIKGVARAYRAQGRHIITSAVEHPAVIEACRHLEADGYQVTYLPVDERGLVEARQVEDAITPQTILVTVMHANNEVGTIQPIAAIAEVARRHRVLFHTDAAQSVGKIPVRVADLGVDLLSVAGHKLYAPKGIGVLFRRRGVRLDKLIDGADHEMNQRAGTENVIEIAGLGAACELVSRNLEAYAGRMRALRDALENGLRQRFPALRVNGHPDLRLPNTSSVSFRGLEANTILSELEAVAASAGAACHSDRVDVSSVLQAMQVPLEYAMGTIRFSVGRFTTALEVEQAVDEVARVVERLQPRGAAPAPEGGRRQIRLTQFTHGLGCACKLRPQLLEAVLKRLPVAADPRVLVGTATSDDAAVYRIDEHTAIVQTVDFFTPVVDDPFQFGAIAAANALSDIYAMGGTPRFALNIVAFPSNRLPVEVLEAILRGAQAKAEEADVAIIGGHTIEDTEPKFGMTVTGVIDPGKILTNSNARPGDALVLTKPLGTGILATAMKRGLLEPDQAQRLVEVMAALNRAAAEAMAATGVNACTDVTGFGLLAHLLEMLRGSHASARIKAGRVPVLPGALEMAAAGVVPGGTLDNRAFTEPSVGYDDAVPEVTRVILNDAQTSGGLLISVPGERVEALLAALAAGGGDGAAIGEVVAGESPRVVVQA